MCEIVEVIPDTGGIPFSPRVKSDDGNGHSSLLVGLQHNHKI